MSARRDVAPARASGGRPRLPSVAVRLLADVLRVGGAGSLVWAAAGGEWVNAALFALVLGGLMLPRMVPTRPVVDLTYGATLLFAAWSAVEDLYVRYDELDNVVHTVACGLVAAVVHRLLVTASVLPPATDRSLRRAGTGVVVAVWALGLALGTLWEAGEWFGHTHLDQRIQVGYSDTIGDLMADCLGALVAGLVVARSARVRSR
ncbi:MAG: hypothetical protein QOD35_1123 [Nocardioidaceae bacterium]|nr:hypothetical protein [Nocardioidaceae bacterium]